MARPDVRLAYRTAGSGDWVVLCHALATRQQIWDAQVESLASRYRVLTFDLRGHGASSSSSRGDYSFESQADDVAALMDHLCIPTAALVGMSVGGEVAQMAVARHPARFQRLALTSTACYTDSARAATWQQRIEAAELQGMHGIAPATAARWFSESFMRRCPEWVDSFRQCVAEMPLESYVGLARVIQTMDLRTHIRSIRCPTVVIYGDQDKNTGAPAAHTLVDLIPGARLMVSAGAGHFPNIETPETYNRMLHEFLT